MFANRLSVSFAALVAAGALAPAAAAQVIPADIVGTLLDLDQRVTLNAGQLTVLDGKVTRDEATITLLDTQGQTLAGQVGTVLSTAAAQTTTIADHTAALADLGTRVQVQGAAIDANVAATAVVGAQVSANTTAIAGLDGRVGATETALGDLGTGVGATEDVVATLGTQVAGNTHAIGTLGTQVGANTTAITGLDGRVTVNEGAIGTLGVQVGANVQAIAGLGGRVTVNEGAINTLGTQVADNTQAIAGLDGRVTATEGATGSLDGRLTANAAHDTAQDVAIDETAAIAVAARDDVVTLRGDVDAGRVGLVRQADRNAPVTVAAQTGGTSVSFAGTSGDRRLTGLAAGVAADDAATVGQVAIASTATLASANVYTDQSSAATLRSANIYSDQTGVTALASANAYTDRSVATMMQDSLDAARQMIAINNVDLRRDMSALAAGSNALAGLPQSIIPGDGMIGASIGGSKGQTAFAMGVSKAFAGEHTPILKAGAALDTRHGDFSYNAAVGFHF